MTLPDGRALLLCYRAEDFDENVVDHLKHPFLPNGEVGHRRGKVNDFDTDAMLLEVLQFCSDVTLVAAETVERLDDERIPLTENGCLECLIA